MIRDKGVPQGNLPRHGSSFVLIGKMQTLVGGGGMALMAHSNAVQNACRGTLIDCCEKAFRPQQGSGLRQNGDHPFPAHDTRAPNAKIEHKHKLGRVALRQIPPLSERAFRRRLLKSLRAAASSWSTSNPCPMRRDRPYIKVR